ncbi:HprK-related kinase A [Massilia sp. Leaf139]|uniref:HprK-related kinase A n=1 Tax=Massilia sp. Leaf139 TaxID=1736272 RepID=UPI0006FA1585|nr:HprK-related kinase A [Massilia sp. Leaf139]KQQ87055.1 aldolase [Massilia sp. Leaf139]
MLTVAQLGQEAVAARLRGAGLRLQTGPFVACIHSSLPALAVALERMYGAYPLMDADTPADFDVLLRSPRGLRRLIKPQVYFHYDGLAPFQPLPLDQTYPMFEWAMNWCISNHAHSWLVIHAAVVEREGAAVILPAPAGSGKSTLCAALVARGWRLLSDELTLIRVDDGRIDPVPRPVSLKNASIDVIRAWAPGMHLSPPVTDTLKGTVAHLRAPDASVARAHEPARPAWIVFPKWRAGAPAELAPVPQARAHLRLAENAFNYSLLGAAGFTTAARTIEQTRTFDFSYGTLDDAMDVFEQLLAGRR